MFPHVPLAFVPALALFTGACASTPPAVDMRESMRVLGRENDVRVHAQIFTNDVRPGALVAITYEIENLRPEPIVFAPVPPSVDYLASNRTITVTLGSEIPDGEALPKLIRIAAGEKVGFTTGARISVPPTPRSALRNHPRYLQVRLSYLDGAEPFEPWLQAEAARGARGMDDGLFRSWIDHVAAVVTNALPIRWSGSLPSEAGAASRSPASGFH